MFKQQKEQESFKLLLLFCNLLHGEGGMRCALGLCRQPRAVTGKTNLLPTSQSPKPIAALGLLRRTLFSGSIPLILRNKKASRMRGLFVWRRRRDSNPRTVFGGYTISSRARSTNYATSPFRPRDYNTFPLGSQQAKCIFHVIFFKSYNIIVIC